MPRKTDSDATRFVFQTDRFVQQNGEWFYMTRDGLQRGPFKSREEAEGDLIFFILECHKKENFNIK
ncbi:MAG: DUF6316 family protein [Gammaproteobacteria bacterium]|jgi:hypothetical protein|nr:DUF6316 family protein [Gammaproteobacteria bacterium]